jgi:hypothetical protein
MPIITLITDYGWRDYYVGAIKGVVLGIAPQANLVDITHDIEPHNVANAAFVLRHALPFYPPGTVHLVVVDPGVGTSRRILLAQYAGQFVVAPDNGIVTWLHRELGAEELRSVVEKKFFRPQSSATFHGRDVMAPVAAHLANGVAASEFGPTTDQVELLDQPSRSKMEAGVLHGRVIYVDRFGNLVTNIHHGQLAALPAGDREIWIGGARVGPLQRTFADVRPGEPLAYIGSLGSLEIAVNQGRAADRFAAGSAAAIEVRSAPRP